MKTGLWFILGSVVCLEWVKLKSVLISVVCERPGFLVFLVTGTGVFCIPRGYPLEQLVVSCLDEVGTGGKWNWCMMMTAAAAAAASVYPTPWSATTVVTSKYF